MRAGIIIMFLLLAACDSMPDMPDFSLPDTTETSSSAKQVPPPPWPHPSLPGMLDEAVIGAVHTVQDGQGEAAIFEITREYQSAAKQPCREYRVNQTHYLACHSAQWKPVRKFP